MQVKIEVKQSKHKGKSKHYFEIFTKFAGKLVHHKQCEL
jgi:hypothetical protein